MRFKQYYEQQQVVGTVEEVEIEGIGRVSARIDTGNTGYNVLHATNIGQTLSNKVRFETIDNKTVTLPIVGEIDILAGKETQKRVVVHLNIRVGSHFYENTPFSLSDRSANEEKVLIGEPFLKKMEALVDTTKATVV